jgi:hypothetical protein
MIVYPSQVVLDLSLILIRRHNYLGKLFRYGEYVSDWINENASSGCFDLGDFTAVIKVFDGPKSDNFR